MFKKTLIGLCLCETVSLVNSMMTDDSFVGAIESKLDGVNKLWEKNKEIVSFSADERDKFCILLNRLQNKILCNSGKEEMTPEDAGNLVRNMRLDGELVLDESSLSALINSFGKMSDILLGKGHEISDEERAALLITLECYANAVPGELTYPFTDEEQLELIEKAAKVYEEVQ